MTGPRGRFISVEGMDGAGKTTQLTRLYERLKDGGFDVIKTREPGGTIMAEKIRALMLDPDTTEHVDAYTELLLVYAARRQHVVNVIRPALANGTWVLCDRFIDSSYAYQILARGLDPALFHVLNHHIVGETLPDLTLFFDLSDTTAKTRLAERVTKFDRLDREEAVFHRKVAEGMRQRARDQQHLVIDANDDVETVYARMCHALTEYLPLANLV